MATAGTLVYSTKLDTSGMDKGLKGMTGKVSSTGSTIKSILGGLGIAALVSKGISTISSSLDGAIKRLDTMNNFPKVMSNLGIDAEKSKKSIDKLSDGLQNVPTTLDEAALAVQRFTSVNNNIEKSTDIFLAVNNAILAGGASAQIQSSALEQLSQAYSKGKPDMMEWRTIQMAMPAQLKQIALAMGYAGGNTAQLGEDLRKGDVSMNEFIGTIMKLNKEGANGFQSFSDQAVNSVGGIGTAITNMKTAITRGVANGLDELDKSLKKANMGGISQMISNYGKGFENRLKVIAQAIPPVIKALADIYHWMKEHEKLVKVLVIAIGSLYVGFKAIMIVKSLVGVFATFAKAITTGIKIFKTLLSIIKIVGTAFKALGAIMMANPITIIIAVIVALVAAFVILWKRSEKFRNFWINLWNGIKNSVSKAWEGIKEGISNIWNGIKNTFNTIINFVKENWKSILLFIVNPFAGAFSYFYKHSEKFRNTVNKFVSSIVNFFKNLPKTLASIPGKIIAIIQKIPYYLGFVIGWIIGKVYLFYKRIWEFLTKDIPNAINTAIEWLKSLPAKIWNVLVVAYNAVSNWVQQMVSKAVEAGTNFVNNVIEFFRTLPGKIWDWLVNTYNRVSTWTTNMINKAIETGRKFVNNVINFFRTLPGKIWTWLVNVVTRIGQWAVNMKNKGVKAAKDLSNAIIDGIKSLPGKMKELGRNIVEGIWTGIKNAKKWLKEKISEFATGIVDGIKSSLKIGSPSKVFRDEVGKWIPEGIAVGIEANTDSALKSINDMSNEMVRKMQSAVNMETGKLSANANIKGNSFLNSTTVNSHVVADVYMDRTKVGQAVTPIIAQTIRKAGA